MTTARADTGLSTHLDTEDASDFVFENTDGLVIVEVKNSSEGVRGLYNGLMELAVALSRRPEARRAYLVLQNPRISSDRLRQEWKAVSSVINPRIAKRLSLISFGKHGTWMDPHNENDLNRILTIVQPASAALPLGKDWPRQARFAPRRKYFEVVKVLIYRWLRKLGPIRLKELQDQVGCAYPTVRDALDRLARRKRIVRHSNRSVELASFPLETWNQLLVLSANIRGGLQYKNASGKPIDFEYLLKRLRKLKPHGIALGGVQSARFWQPDFDLNGIPRLDLIAHVPNGRIDHQFVSKLDPALRLVDENDIAPVVVIHPLVRRASFFETPAAGELPLCDPVEAVLDLCEIGLTEQANQVLSRFRPELKQL